MEGKVSSPEEKKSLRGEKRKDWLFKKWLHIQKPWEEEFNWMRLMESKVVG
jgi:hypothetical protein